MSYPNHGRHFLNSFFPYISRLWNNLPSTTKCKNVQYFKIQFLHAQEYVGVSYCCTSLDIEGDQDGNLQALTRNLQGRRLQG